ncbi:hypothetical protein [uncultured Phascolarctobacterium sp.]|uniref:hypothetical protein n=1 Tax=uncultured Phascolarctobacterium sp. TaxID=512296 RepID=UPI0027D9410B|nr:hypothetical protein [uncultured Phascolarctobacterium sp.]
MFKQILYNLKISFLAQLSSVFVSIGMGLLLPKFISIEAYGYWQIFILYCTCFELSMFGIPNGIFLRNAGKIPLHAAFVKTTLIIVLSLSFIWCGVILTLSAEDANYSYVYKVLATALIVINIATFFSYILQSRNEIKYNALVNLLSNLIIAIGLCFLFVIRISDLCYYISVFLFAHIVRLLLLSFHEKNIFYEKININIKYGQELFVSISTGIKLIIIDYTTILVFGVIRLASEKYLGIILFSKLSFAFSIIMLAINFINQIVLSIIPSLRSLESNEIRNYYIKQRKMIGLFFCMMMFCYFPAVIFLRVWLPQYEESFLYMFLLFPLMVFEGKMQAIFSLFLKVLRYENLLLKINCLYSIILLSFSCLMLSQTANIYYVIVCIVLFSCFRSTLSELICSKLLGIKGISKNIILELCLVCIFYCLNYMNDNAFVAMILIFVILYFYYFKDDIRVDV